MDPTTRNDFATSLRGYVVAGGRSSRIGRDKALLPYGESTLLEHAIVLARAVTPDVRILCGPAKRYEEFDVPIVVDAICGVGPLGGLYSALLDGSIDGCDRIFWIGVDLPHVTADFLTALVTGLDRADVVMARSSRGDEPLCAAFRTEAAIAAARRALLQGRLKLTSALEGLSVQSVEADLSAFANINTLDDYHRLQRG